VSVPTGAAAEVHEPEPPESVAVHSDVEPLETVTEPVGVPGPEVTDAEYVTEEPDSTALGLAVIDVCVGAGLTTRAVVPVDTANKGVP
jgi:hypothetical protein